MSMFTAHPEQLDQRPDEEIAAEHQRPHERVAGAGEPDAQVVCVMRAFIRPTAVWRRRPRRQRTGRRRAARAPSTAWMPRPCTDDGRHRGCGRSRSRRENTSGSRRAGIATARKSPRRQQVEREHLAAEHGLDRHREDDEALDLEKPERQQAEAVGDAELDQRRTAPCAGSAEREPPAARAAG